MEYPSYEKIGEVFKMKKADVQQLYKEVKRKRFMALKQQQSSLFEDTKSKGCRTCGKITWKP